MAHSSRQYQADAEEAISAGWGSHNNQLLVLPTGAGKTFTFSNILRAHKGWSCAVAHRQELVIQISTALARAGVKHQILAPAKVVRLCIKEHMRLFGKSPYCPNARCVVAGVDTLLRRDVAEFFAKVTLWVMDEAHHVLKGNKWGKAVARFTNPKVKGLGVTATPRRADGKGLGAANDGVFHSMYEGPTMRELIDMGYLTDYRIVAPPTSGYSRANIEIGSNGELVAKSVKKAMQKSTITGDVVKHYKAFAQGKLGITFAIDVESAEDIAAEFNAAGVPALAVSARNTDAERVEALRKFANREILQLVNCDLFGEGFDLPAIEVVSFARPTKSYALYVQQFGRALRLLLPKEVAAKWESFTPAQRLKHIAASDKPAALIIDHVGNCDLLSGGHPLPDAHVTWSLDGREKRSSAPSDAIPTRTCLECMSVYERIYLACPYCDHIDTPTQRSGPEYVDGDLAELSPEALAAMREAVAELNKPVSDYVDHIRAAGVPPQHVTGMANRYAEKLEKNTKYQGALQASMAWWAGMHKAKGLGVRESHRLFYYTFGVDVLSAQAMVASDAVMLADKINTKIGQSR